ncbi:hypothetical protein [uncultured Photobacterium sp.]|uniref:hypothetical protein n=1 Tax=uncultured Photobacterium sp. TaxID=173973 RepID=UPI00263557C7|nr:hypothetical protein [uncultured Photobacterium sp.]
MAKANGKDTVMTRNNNSGAPGWVLPILIMFLLALQLTLRAEDVKAQQIDILHGETLKAWNELETGYDKEAVNDLG